MTKAQLLAQNDHYRNALERITRLRDRSWYRANRIARDALKEQQAACIPGSVCNPRYMAYEDGTVKEIKGQTHDPD